MNQSTHPHKAGREVTGRFVLACFIGFFGVIFAVNGVLVKVATSSFRGLETGSAYQAGQNFKQEIAAARAQDVLRWSVQAKLSRAPAGAAAIEIAVRDADGRPPPAVTATARLKHPADAGRDRVVVLRQDAPGMYSGETEAASGQWDMQIELLRDGERLYRSESRALLR